MSYLCGRAAGSLGLRAQAGRVGRLRAPRAITVVEARRTEARRAYAAGLTVECNQSTQPWWFELEASPVGQSGGVQISDKLFSPPCE